MRRFKNILLLFDEGVRGEAALARAATLAKEDQAQLTVVEDRRKDTSGRGLLGLDGQAGGLCLAGDRVGLPTADRRGIQWL